MPEPIPFPKPVALINGPSDVLYELGVFQERLEEGEWGDIRTIVMAMEDADGIVHKYVLGPSDTRRCKAIGLLMMAVHQLMEGE